MNRPANARSRRIWPVFGVAVLLAGAAGLLPVLAQEDPESLLPPGLDRPARPARVPRHAEPTQPAPEPAAPVSHPVIEAGPLVGGAGAGGDEPVGLGAAGAARSSVVVRAPALGSSAIGAMLPPGITSFAALMALPPGQIDTLLGVAPGADISASSRRALSHVGIVDEGEGGLPGAALAHQDAGLVRAALAGNNGQMVSRWGHILLRRALGSRLDSPDGMDGAEFAALRAGLLVRMGEGDAARALVQDVDPDNYGPDLTGAALNAYIATEDLTGACPLTILSPSIRSDATWQVISAICTAFNGSPVAGLHQLDRMTRNGTMPHIDMLLAQKYAGAAGSAGGSGHRAVTIEWDGVSGLPAMRASLALATGLTPPAGLANGAGLAYDQQAALAPMLGLGERANASDRAGGSGVLSAAAMVDLYSQIYNDDGITGDAADRANGLRDCYVAGTPEDRLKAMQQLWDVTAPLQHYSRQVLTAYAAARLPANSAMAASSGDIIASMLAAGLDANALRWVTSVDAGSQGWALLELSAPETTGPVSEGGVRSFQSGDTSTASRKSAFLLAGLYGLGRVSQATARNMDDRLGAHLDSATRWTTAIDKAASVGNQPLVALLAGLGMQGDGWDKMTPRYLYHIVGALNRVGLGAEARMIAAEAVARG